MLQRIQSTLPELYIGSLNTDLRVTFSAGVAELTSGQTIGKADLAMCRAKAAGRNRVCAVENDACS